MQKRTVYGFHTINELKSSADAHLIDQKKKKSPKRQEKESNFDMNTLSVYDVNGLKGKPGLYFKDLEETESTVEKMQKVKGTIDNLAFKSPKNDIRCASLLRYKLPLETTVKFVQSRAKFSYKSILNEGVK